MRKLNNVNPAFVAGALFAGAIYCLFQDIMGLDRYIAFAKAHWVTGWVTVPLEIVLIIISIVVLAVCMIHEREMVRCIRVIVSMKAERENKSKDGANGE